MITRRNLMRSGVAATLGAVLPHMPEVLAESDARLGLSIRGNVPVTTIPRDFIGLGYEESSVAIAGLLSNADSAYVQLVRNLGRHGVLRAGGIVADFTAYSANGHALSEPKNTIITRSSLKQLRGFLDAVEWTVLWSVNFGRGSLEESIVEAKEVASILGPRLLAIELGNEVENYSKGRQPLRPPSYSFGDYLAEFHRWRKAMLDAVPGLRFAAPDTADSIDWVENMAARSAGEVQLLTTHYYRGDQKLGTRDELLHTDAKLMSNVERLQRASKQSGIPWRLCETNSFYGGGRPGLSDTLAGSLWTLDTMFLLARSGCAGVNMETGVNQLGFVSSYSPIRNDEAGRITAGAPYYGMLAFRVATENAPDVLPIDFDPQGTNVTAYALGRNGRMRSLVVINKMEDRGVRMPIGRLRLEQPSLLRLSGDSLDSKVVTFAGEAVDAGGRWIAAEHGVMKGDELYVPAHSAALLRGTA